MNNQRMLTLIGVLYIIGAGVGLGALVFIWFAGGRS